MARRKVHGARGFTLIELMLVVVIIGILSSFAVPRILRSAARAQHSEMLIVIQKIRQHFLNQYRNQGFYTLADRNGGSGDSAWNPLDTNPLGQPAYWLTNATGWSDYSFPPDGRLKMRYMYTASGQTLVITAKGSFPGFDGVYQYTETYQGESQVSAVEAPPGFDL